MVGGGLGRSTTRHPLNSTATPEVEVCLPQELFLCFIIYIVAQELERREENTITTSSLPIPGTEKRVWVIRSDCDRVL